MDLKSILPHLVFKFPHEADLLRAIEELSKKFTVDRNHIEDYLRDPRLASAYTAFYLATNIAKFEAILPWFSQKTLENFKECSLIDVGAGPGTFSLAFRVWRGPGEILQIENSKLMREQALSLWEGLFPGEPIAQNSSIKSEAPKLMLFGHSANEMGPLTALNYIATHDPDHVLFIEPGTKEFFPQMLEIREALLNKGYRILYPCPNGESCPIQETDDWCHQYVHVSHPADVERLTQKASMDRRNLPLIVHLYSKTIQEINVQERVLRVYPETKFSFEWDVCHENRKEHYQIQKRNLGKSQQKEIARTTLGDGIETELEKEFDGIKRVKLKS